MNLQNKIKGGVNRLKKAVNSKPRTELYGLNQGRFNHTSNLLSSRQGVRKYWKYRTSPERVISVSSGSVILSTGLGIAFTILALSENMLSFFGETIYYGPGTVAGLVYLFSSVILTIAFNPFRLIPSLTTGWFAGGILSSFFYKRNGRRGPLYSIYLVVSMSLSLVFIVGLLTLKASESKNSLSLLIISIQQLMIISLGIGILSLPLAFVAWVGYKLGMFFIR